MDIKRDLETALVKTTEAEYTDDTDCYFKLICHSRGVNMSDYVHCSRNLLKVPDSGNL